MIDSINVANTFTQDGSTTRIVRADGQELSRERFDFYFFIQRHNESEGYRDDIYRRQTRVSLINFYDHSKHHLMSRQMRSTPCLMCVDRYPLARLRFVHGVKKITNRYRFSLEFLVSDVEWWKLEIKSKKKKRKKLSHVGRSKFNWIRFFFRILYWTIQWMIKCFSWRFSYLIYLWTKSQRSRRRAKLLG